MYTLSPVLQGSTKSASTVVCTCAREQAQDTVLATQGLWILSEVFG